MYRTAEPKPVIRRMAEDLGVHHEAPRNWIRQAEADAGERDDLLISQAWRLTAKQAYGLEVPDRDEMRAVTPRVSASCRRVVTPSFEYAW